MKINSIGMCFGCGEILEFDNADETISLRRPIVTINGLFYCQYCGKNKRREYENIWSYNKWTWLDVNASNRVSAFRKTLWAYQHDEGVDEKVLKHRRSDKLNKEMVITIKRGD